MVGISLRISLKKKKSYVRGLRHVNKNCYSNVALDVFALPYYHKMEMQKRGICLIHSDQEWDSPASISSQKIRCPVSCFLSFMFDLNFVSLFHVDLITCPTTDFDLLLNMSQSESLVFFMKLSLPCKGEGVRGFEVAFKVFFCIKRNKRKPGRK